jgi:uncharacterized membrane protein YsdA (DUF1294 family)
VSPFKRYLLLAVLFGLSAFALLYNYTSLKYIYLYLIAVNTAMFLLYGIDKFAAMRSYVRTPERLLHLTAFVGGSPAALLGQQLFWHKVSKGRFLVWYWVIVVLQAGLLYVWFYTDILVQFRY